MSNGSYKTHYFLTLLRIKQVVIEYTFLNICIFVCANVTVKDFKSGMSH